MAGIRIDKNSAGQDRRHEQEPSQKASIVLSIEVAALRHWGAPVGQPASVSFSSARDVRLFGALTNILGIGKHAGRIAADATAIHAFRLLRAIDPLSRRRN